MGPRALPRFLPLRASGCRICIFAVSELWKFLFIVAKPLFFLGKSQHTVSAWEFSVMNVANSKLRLSIYQLQRTAEFTECLFSDGGYAVVNSK